MSLWLMHLCVLCLHCMANGAARLSVVLGVVAAIAAVVVIAQQTASQLVTVQNR